MSLWPLYSWTRPKILVFSFIPILYIPTCFLENFSEVFTLGDPAETQSDHENSRETDEDEENHEKTQEICEDPPYTASSPSYKRVDPPEPEIVIHRPLKQLKTESSSSKSSVLPLPRGSHHATTNGTALLNHIAQKHFCTTILDKKSTDSFTKDDMKSLLNICLCNYFAWELDRDEK